MVNEVLNITSKNVKTLIIPFMSRLYRRIEWGSLEVNTLLDCIAYLFWKKGRVQSCVVTTRGLMDPDLARAIAEIKW